MGGSDSPGLLVGFGWRRRCVGVVVTTLTLERGYDDDDEEEKKSVGSGVGVAQPLRRGRRVGMIKTFGLDII